MLELLFGAWCGRLTGSCWLWFPYYLNLLRGSENPFKNKSNHMCCG